MKMEEDRAPRLVVSTEGYLLKLVACDWRRMQKENIWFVWKGIACIRVQGLVNPNRNPGQRFCRLIGDPEGEARGFPCALFIDQLTNPWGKQ